MFVSQHSILHMPVTKVFINFDFNVAQQLIPKCGVVAARRSRNYSARLSFRTSFYNGFGGVVSDPVLR